MKMFAVVRTTVPFLHRYPDAPDEVYFLREDHRHLLHVEVKLEQFHDNRDVEYILFKKWLDDILKRILGMMDVSSSCEMISRKLGVELEWKFGERDYEIQIMEDGENGCLLVESS